ncbi:MAG: enoyl-CoA hydratase/isomerase family protein [Actinobacteria bacterium]|nr:enoyl-CoA hydratase/isomerase family protein [Actinomycetota bacterium]
MDEILASQADGVLILRLNRPAKMNAITTGMYVQLRRHLKEAADDFAIRCVLIRGEGANFTAGNDINDFMADSLEVEESDGFNFLVELHNFPKPIVTIVQGRAIGIGTTMLLHCDVVVADPTAVFSMPFVSLGLVPEAGSSYLFPQLVGYQRASRIFLTGDSFTAHEALQMGLVSSVSENAAIEGYELATRIAKQPPAAVLNTKALLKSRNHDAVSMVMGAEAQLFTMALQSEEAAQAFMEFMKRRENK